jgi:hypothetical protein
MRGVILGPKIDEGGTRIHSNDAIDGAVRRSLLYYDKIEVPSMNLLFMQPSSIMRELMAIGVMQRTHATVTLDGMVNPGDLFGVIQCKLFEHLEVTEPGVWSLTQESASLSLPPAILVQSRSLQVCLTNLLPVPADDVPVADILRFKEKRAPELRAFDAAMDDLYMLIANSTDQNRAYEIAKNRICLAVADMFKALKQSMATRMLAFAKFGVHTTQGISAAALGNTVGVAQAGVQLAAMAMETPTTVKRLGPFAFVHQVIADLA